MHEDWSSRLRSIEGRQVSIALNNGVRFDDCELVSMGHHRVASLWLFADGADVFVPFDAILDVWESTPQAAA
jgi:hypothetical protein